MLEEEIACGAGHGVGCDCMGERERDIWIEGVHDQLRGEGGYSMFRSGRRGREKKRERKEKKR